MVSHCGQRPEIGFVAVLGFPLDPLPGNVGALVTPERLYIDDRSYLGKCQQLQCGLRSHSYSRLVEVARGTNAETAQLSRVGDELAERGLLTSAWQGCDKGIGHIDEVFPQHSIPSVPAVQPSSAPAITQRDSVPPDVHLPVPVTQDHLSGLQERRPGAAILFVVEEETYNVCDQRNLEYAIREMHESVKVMRRKFSELHNCTIQEGNLIVDGVEIAVVYYRTAYAPQQMDAKCWDTRLRIELSRAIKCPSVQYHLAGTKKVQQVLAQPDVLERFFTNKVIANSIRATFTGLYSLDLVSTFDYIIYCENVQEPEPQFTSYAHSMLSQFLK
ncbi:hypothetical protein HPB51_004161 [Rhipicephalus microplus]|uniref:Glutathione synthetase n=1 Tax=Rhipicephalus microplus TaxID=6941 RepID=A0A9J6D3W7_RHIMP|nr:hypothetical protein HPB51_004161 [Rhipicephalus microplus]